MTTKPLALVAAVMALGVPATAVAAKPDHTGKPDKPAKTEHASSKAKGHAKKPRNAVFKGAVVSIDGTTVTVHVDKANRWGRALKDTDVAFDVSKLKKAVTVTAGDQVLVQARVSKDAVPPFTARKLNKLSGDDGSGDDATPEPSPSPEPTTTPDAG